MRVEKVPDSTYDMVGGLDKQIREIKEVIELPVKVCRTFSLLLPLAFLLPLTVILQRGSGETYIIF